MPSGLFGWPVPISLPGSVSLLLHCEKIMARNLIWSQGQLPGVTSASKCEIRMLRRWALFHSGNSCPRPSATRTPFGLPGHGIGAAQTRSPGFWFIQAHPELNQRLYDTSRDQTIHCGLYASIPSPRDATSSGVWWIYGITTGGRQGIHWVLVLPLAVRAQLWLTSSSSSGSGGAGSREM